jgi:hypothetical protein
VVVAAAVCLLPLPFRATTPCPPAFIYPRLLYIFVQYPQSSDDRPAEKRARLPYLSAHTCHARHVPVLALLAVQLPPEPGFHFSTPAYYRRPFRRCRPYPSLRRRSEAQRAIDNEPHGPQRARRLARAPGARPRARRVRPRRRRHLRRGRGARALPAQGPHGGVGDARHGRAAAVGAGRGHQVRFLGVDVGAFGD